MERRARHSPPGSSAGSPEKSGGRTRGRQVMPGRVCGLGYSESARPDWRSFAISRNTIPEIDRLLRAGKAFSRGRRPSRRAKVKRVRSEVCFVAIDPSGSIQPRKTPSFKLRCRLHPDSPRSKPYMMRIASSLDAFLCSPLPGSLRPVAGGVREQPQGGRGAPVGFRSSRRSGQCDRSPRPSG